MVTWQPGDVLRVKDLWLNTGWAPYIRKVGTLVVFVRGTPDNLWVQDDQGAHHKFIGGGHFVLADGPW